MEKKYIFTPPFKRTIEVNTLCVVGVCTCIMIKMAAEKAFAALGIKDIDVQPSVEDNPRGERSRDPDVIVIEGSGMRVEELQEKLPRTIFVEMKDLAKQDLFLEDLTKALTDAGWLTVIEE